MGIMKDQIGVDDFPMKGFSVLLKAIVIPEVTRGGIILTQTTINMEKREHNIGLVLAVGEEAYEDKSRFPNGPRCKVGDWVFFSRYETQPIPLNEHLCYFLTDDRIITDFPESLLPAIVPELRNRADEANNYLPKGN